MGREATINSYSRVRMARLVLVVAALAAPSTACSSKAAGKEPDPSPTNSPGGAPLQPDGLVIVGGSNGNDLATVETYPTSECTIPALPTGRRGHSVDLLLGPPATVVVCGGSPSSEVGDSCVSWTGGQAGWRDYATMRKKRAGLTSWWTGDRLLVMGGEDGAENTGEVITGGVSTTTFPLTNSGEDSCGIPLAGEMVLTGGGYPAHGKVDRYGPDGSHLGALPSMVTARRRHACASYSTGGYQVLLVTAGVDSSNGNLDTTELLEATATGWAASWRQLAARLPRAVNGARAATVQNTVMMAGGFDLDNYRNEVLEFKPEEEGWVKVGAMQESRYGHAMVAADLTALCG